MMVNLPYLGHGLGLCPMHYQTILEILPAVDWFSIPTESYLVPGGRPLYFLDRICERYPIALHGSALSIGSTDLLDWDYLKKLKVLAQRTRAQWISDHLCWTGVNGSTTYDVLPLPYTEETIQHIVTRIQQVQDFLGQRILIENISNYIGYRISNLSEYAFIKEIAERADCFIILNLNSMYVNAYNYGFSVDDYLKAMPHVRVKQLTLTGHQKKENYLIDAPENTMSDFIFALYERAHRLFGPLSTLIEREHRASDLSILLKEVARAATMTKKMTGEFHAVA